MKAQPLASIAVSEEKNTTEGHSLEVKLKSLRLEDSLTQMPDEVIRRYAYKKRISLKDARDLFGELELFLDDAANKQLEPTESLDEAWHEFILHTRLYACYCASKYGRFIHHVPTSPISLRANEDELPTMSDALTDPRTTRVSNSGRDRNCATDCRSESQIN